MEFESLVIGLLVGAISGGAGVLYALLRTHWLEGKIYDTMTGYVSQLLEETFKNPKGLVTSLKPVVMGLIDDIGGEIAAKMPQGGGNPGLDMLGEIPLQMIPKKWRGALAIAQFFMGGRKQSQSAPQLENRGVVG